MILPFFRFLFGPFVLACAAREHSSTPPPAARGRRGAWPCPNLTACAEAQDETRKASTSSTPAPANWLRLALRWSGTRTVQRRRRRRRRRRQTHKAPQQRETGGTGEPPRVGAAPLGAAAATAQPQRQRRAGAAEGSTTGFRSPRSIRPRSLSASSCPLQASAPQLPSPDSPCPAPLLTCGLLLWPRTRTWREQRKHADAQRAAQRTHKGTQGKGKEGRDGTGERGCVSSPVPLCAPCVSVCRPAPLVRCLSVLATPWQAHSGTGTGTGRQRRKGRGTDRHGNGDAQGEEGGRRGCVHCATVVDRPAQMPSGSPLNGWLSRTPTRRLGRAPKQGERRAGAGGEGS
jgi:hypothetical protein